LIEGAQPLIQPLTDEPDEWFFTPEIEKEHFQIFVLRIQMRLLQLNQLIQSQLQTIQAIFDSIDELRDGNFGSAGYDVSLEVTIKAEQLLVAVDTFNLLANEVDVILTTGARCCIVLKELPLFLLGLHMCCFVSYI
jgi:hypothetical protein